MAKRVLRVGIGGYGRSGCDIHAQWLRQDPGKYRIVAVSDEMPERRAEAARDFNCAVYAGYRELLRNTEMDVFVNALPSLFHVSGSVEALRRGCHVVCEKPLAARVKEFDRVVAAARKARKVFAPFQNSRFYPSFAKMREVIASGVLGPILHIRIIWSGFSRRWDWQTFRKWQGGNLLNTGPHPLDHAVMLFGGGRKTPKVFCRMKSVQPFGGDADDFCAVTLYGGASDPVIEILLSSYLAYPVGRQYTVCGVYGGLAGDLSGLEWRYYDPRRAPGHRKKGVWSEQRRYCSEELRWIERSWQPPESKRDGFTDNSKAFYDNVYNAVVKKAQLVVKPEEVRRQVAVIEACRRQNPRSGRAAGRNPQT